MRSRSRFIAFALLSTPVAAAKLDRDAIEQAEWHDQPRGSLSPSLLKAQVLLDRARFSPGEIDGKLGGYVVFGDPSDGTWTVQGAAMEVRALIETRGRHAPRAGL